MDSIESLVWLKRKRLFKKCVVYSEKLKVVFKECLKAENDDVLIIGDTGRDNYNLAAIYSGACFLAARGLNINARFVLQEPKKSGEYAHPETVKALEQIRPGGVLVLGLSGRIGVLYNGQKTFKRFCQEKRLRYATTTSLGSLRNNVMPRLLSAIDVDYRNLKGPHDRLKRVLDFGRSMHITTKAGTDLKIGIEGCTSIASNGYYWRGGYGGNLPAGEVFIAPAKKKVEGKVVVDVSSRNRDSTVLVKKPITFTVKNGEVVKISGGKEARMLSDTIRWAETYGKHDWGVRRIGEIGIGLNPQAKVSGSMIIDEKVKGTAHVAIGSNNWFGGGVYAVIHLDQVFKNPKITVDGRLLRI